MISDWSVQPAHESSILFYIEQPRGPSWLNARVILVYSSTAAFFFFHPFLPPSTALGSTDSPYCGGVRCRRKSRRISTCPWRGGEAQGVRREVWLPRGLHAASRRRTVRAYTVVLKCTEEKNKMTLLYSTYRTFNVRYR